jgi:tol-pal system protein YbgF
MRMTRTRLTHGAALAALGLALLPSPLRAADREHQQIMAELRMLQEQTLQLQALMNGLSDTLKAVSGRIDEQTALERKAFADAKVQMDTLSGDVRTVREKVDETNVRLSQLSQELDAIRDAIPQPGQVIPSSGATPDGAAMPPSASTAPPAGLSPTRVFGEAFGDYSVGNYTLAIQGFETYLGYWPKGVGAAEAQLYIGRSHDAQKKYSEAVVAFDRVIANYPGSDHVPEAHFRRGGSLERLGQADGARQSYEAVIKQYPDSDAARLAKQRLPALKGPAR